MKNKILPWMFTGSVMGAVIATMLLQIHPVMNGEAATLTVGYNFATNEQVTAAKLASMVNNATISSIDTADITDGAVTTLKLGANSVTGAKIVNGTIEAGDISNRTITASLIATNTITATELNTNLTFGAGIIDFGTATVLITNQTLAASSVAGVTNSTGAADSAKIVKLNPSGQLDGSFFKRFVTNVVLGADDTLAAGQPFTSKLSYTTTLGTGATVIVQAQMAMKGNGDFAIGRLTDGAQFYDNLSDSSSLGNYAGEQHPGRYSLVLTLVTNVAIQLQVKTAGSGSGATIYQHKATGGTGNPVMSNITYMTITEIK